METRHVFPVALALALLFFFGCAAEPSRPATPARSQVAPQEGFPAGVTNQSSALQDAAPSGLVWYFAYGSNLNFAGMRSRVGSWPEARKATLMGFRRTFSGAATIAEDNSSEVFGAVYLLNESQMLSLDRYEGVPRSYVRINVSVLSGNISLPAVAYQFTSPRKFATPSQGYLEIIRQGLLDHGYGQNEIGLLLSEANSTKS